ncbi:XRE family transcriptional regulator [Hymenobacter sp. BT491]|uniref:XRE family transcriptional regulator n=1 Tax=Hymenobacter sp. BT491 TaxID=2766779 RepID=UPI001653D97F|nr:LexA family transcriptional regulator [Hymenobacter sp. BT491]MBC6988539.1 helix-turn-helix domain-containing protein [Hymenobacter sp. BT491]
MTTKKSINTRLKELRVHLQLDQKEMARQFGKSVQAWSALETGRNKLTEETILLLVEKFNVNPQWLLLQQGPMLLSMDSVPSQVEEPSVTLQQSGNQIITVTVDSAGNENITQVSTRARAGYVAGGFLEPEYLKDLPAFSLPGTRFRNGTFRAFEIAGDSMTNVLYAGDLVIAQKLYNWATEIREGYVHIVVTRDDILVKRVLNRLEDSGHLVLKSENLAFPTQLLEGEEVLEVWLAKAKLSSQFINSRYDVVHELFETQANLAELAAEFDDLKKAVASKLGVPARELGAKKNSRKIK